MKNVALYLSNHKKYGGMIYMENPELYYKLKHEADNVNPLHSIIKNSDIHEQYHEALSGGKKDDAFIKQLTEVGMTSTEYLHAAKLRAYQAGYDPSLLSFANDNIHKLQYKTPNGIRKFGRVSYRDHIIWKHLEDEGTIDPGYANMKRHVFRESHGKISRIYHLDKYSPNEMAINILW